VVKEPPVGVPGGWQTGTVTKPPMLKLFRATHWKYQGTHFQCGIGSKGEYLGSVCPLLILLNSERSLQAFEQLF